MDYKEYLDKARIKQLAELQARYNQVYAKERAEAASSLIAGHRQLRRGLQNVGLAGRKGNLISGREKTAALEARRRYREYNAGLSRAANTFTTAAGQRMARQAIDDENRVKRAEAYAKWGDEYAAAKAEAEKEYAAKLEEAKQEHLQYAQEYQNSYNAYLAQQAQYQAWLQQQAAAQQSAQQELIDPRFQGNNMQQAKQDLMAARAEQQRIQAENQRLQMQQLTQDGVDPRLSGAQNTQQAKLQAASAAAVARRENELRNNDIDPRFAQNSMMQQTKPQASAIAASRRYEAVQAQYEQNLNEWREKIQRAEGITKPKTRNEYDKWHEAQVARQHMIDYERRVEALKYPAISNLITLSDSEFAMRYDAAEKAYKHALQDAKILRKDSSSSMDDLSSEANGIEGKATAEFVKWQNAAHARADAQARFYADSVQPDMTLAPHAPAWANKTAAENWKTAYQKIENNEWRAHDYDIKNAQNGNRTVSKYAALVNDWSFISGDMKELYSFRGSVDNFFRDIAEAGESVASLFDSNGLKISSQNAYKHFLNQCTNWFYNLHGQTASAQKKDQMTAMLALANIMTDEERARFNTILKTHGRDEADKYFEFLYTSVLPGRMQQKVDLDYDALLRRESIFDENGNRIGAKDGKDTWLGKAAMSVWSVPGNIMQGASSPMRTLGIHQNDVTAANLGAMQGNTAQGMREAVQENFSNAGRFWYGTGMSMADSATVAAISAGIGSVFHGAGLAAKTASRIGSAIGGSLLGGSAFNASYSDALNNGLTPEKARWTAVGNGLNEMLFETLSIGTLLEKTGKSVLKPSKNAWVNLFVNSAVQAGVEGSEEVFTDIANKIWDNKINGVFSEEMQKIREYVASGMTFAEAKAKVNREFAEQLGMSFLGGAISGGFMGGGAQFVNMISNRQLEAYGKTLSQEHIDDLKKYEYKSEQAQEILNSGTITNTDAAMLDIIHTQELVEESINYVEQAVTEGKMPQQIADIYKKFAEHSVQTETNPDGITDEEAEKMLPYVDTIKNAEAIKQGLGKIVEQQTAARKEFDALSFEQKQQRLQNITNETTALRNAPSLRVGASESRLSGQSAAQEFTTRAKTDTITLNNDGSVKTANGSVTFDFGANKTVDAMTDNQARAIRFAAAVANKTGVNIKVEQEFVGDDRNKNGEYNPETNTIRVNLSGTNSAIYTMSHELTHYLQSNNKQAFADLSKAIQKQLSRTDLVGSDLPSDYQDIIGDYLTGDNTLWQALCAYEKERYAKEKINLTQAQVEEEVIARCCESFLGNSSLIADMTQNHTKSARAVYRFLNEIRADINALRADASERMAERGYEADFSPEQGMLEQFADIDKIVKLWENGLRKVAKKNKVSGEKMASIAVAEKNRAHNQRQTEVGSPLKTLNGSTISRSKIGVGKQMADAIYVHKNYASEVVPADVLPKAKAILKDKHPGFKYNCIKYDAKKGTVAFQEAPDFDTAREPKVGDYVTVNVNDSTTKTGHSEYIWHHKWEWVKNDYKGFDVEESWDWSKQWLSTLTETSDGNGIARWNAQLDRFGLPRDGAKTMYSLSAVAPVMPNEDSKWKRGVTNDEIREVYPKFRSTDSTPVAVEELNPNFEERKAERIELSKHPRVFKKGNATQVTNTRKTYMQLIDQLKRDGFKGTILDASSGLGIGTDYGLQQGFDIEDIEPFYDEEYYKPMYSDYSRLNKKYDAIISSAVVNVLPADDADAMVSYIGKHLKDGGVAYITVRAKSAVRSDLMGRGAVPIGEDARFMDDYGNQIGTDGEFYVKGNANYQRGWTTDEFESYVKDVLGAGYTVERNPSTDVIDADGNVVLDNEGNPKQKKWGDVSVKVTKNGTMASLSDKQYLDLAKRYESGDKAAEAELRKAVDAAAKAAGYNTKAYHGTRRMFNVFRGANEMGYHFGTKAAAQGRVGRGKAARIIPAYIRANNPIVFDFDMGSWDANFRLADELHEMKVLSVDELNEVKYGNDGVRRFKRSDESANKILQGILKAKGYDSIKYKNTMETKSSWSYIVYDASQAKSANLVTYDSDGNIIPLSERFKTDRTGEDAWKNEDIRFSLKDNVERKYTPETTMTMQQAKRMLEMTFNANGFRGYKGYKTADEWLQSEGAAEVAWYAENTETVVDQYFNRFPELTDYEVTIKEVLEAYQKGTLVGKEKTAKETIDLKTGNGYKDSRFYAPKLGNVTEETIRTANLRVTSTNRDKVYAARRDVLFAAHTEEGIAALGLTQKELNKRLQNWSRYSERARTLSMKLNQGVAEEYWWTGLQNSSILSTINVTDQDIRSLVKDIIGTSSEYQRNYIGRTMLALDTHIDWSELTFEFTRTANAMEGARGYYDDNNRHIAVGSSGYLNTVAHEMGHALDYKWGRDLFTKMSVPITQQHASNESKIASEDGRKFYHHFAEFSQKVEDACDIRSSYTQRGTEAFARFVARFVEWTANTAGSQSNYEAQYYNDRFTTGLYLEFVQILQEKARLDSMPRNETRASIMDKVRLSTADGTRTFTYGDVTAKMYGNDVTLDGGKVRQRVQMLETLAERYDHVTVDASSEAEARAFENAGAKRVADEFSTGNEYGTYEFRFVESQFKRDSQFDAKQKANFAKEVLKQVGSRRNFTDQQMVKYRAALERAMTYLWNSTYGKGDQMAAYDAVDRLFDRILNGYSMMTEADADMRDTLMSQMRKLKTANGRTYYQLDVTETQMSEIRNAHGDLKTYANLLSKALGARVVVKQVDGATMLENTFKDANDSRIKNDTVEGNMPGELLRLAQKTMEKRTNPYESESNERAAKKEAMWDAALDIIGGEKSTQQKIRDAVKEARAAERKAAKDKTAKAVDEARLAERMHEGATREQAMRELKEKHASAIEEQKTARAEDQVRARKAIESARLAERMHEGAVRAKERRISDNRERALRQHMADRESRLKQQFRETTARTNEERLKRDMRKVALKWNQRLVKLLANPTEVSHVPVQLAREVAELTKTITEYIDSGTERGRINLEKIAKAYQQAFDDQATIRAAKEENRKYDPRGSVIDREMYDEQLVDMIDEMNEILADKSFKELSAREMMGLLNIIRGVAHTVYDANRMIGTTERKAIWQVGDKMVSELESAPKIKGGFARFFLEESLDLRRIAKVFSGSNENAEFVKLSDMLNRGAIEKERVAQVLSGMFDPLTQQYGEEIRKWYGKNAEWIDTGITKNGRKVEITKGMRVSLAMHVLNAGNMRHIENGGVTIPNRELYAKGKLTDAYANGTLVRLNADQINAIISQMTEAEKAYVEVAKEFFHQRTGYYVNKTSLQLLGYRKATVENYFPIHTDKNYTKSDFASVVRDGSIEGQGFLKERVMASNPVYLEDITSVVNRQIKGVSLYAGLAVPMRNFNAVMNASVYEDENGNWVPRTTVRKAMTQSMGDYGTKVVQGFLQDVSGMSAVDVTPGERLVAKLQTRYVKAVLLANLKVTLKQAASYPTAAAVIPWKYLSKALLKGGRNQRLISRADVDLINQYTPLYKIRLDGMANEITSIMAERGLEQKMPWLLGWITKMDVATVGRLWSACEYMVADQQNLPVGSDEYYKAVAEVFNQTIQQTQPNFTPLQRNAALRSKNPVVRTLTLFGTQRMQNGGILIESAMELAHSKNMSKEAQAAAKAKFGRAVVSQLVQNVMLVAIGFVVDALRGRMKEWQDDDKDVTLESVAKVMGDQFLGNIFGSFLGGSELWDIVSTMFKRATNANAYDTEFTVPSIDAIETIIGFFNKDSVSFVQYMSGDHTADEKITRLKNFSFKVAKAAGYLTGFPFENIAKTIVKGWIPALQDIYDATQTGELIPWLHQSGKLDSKKIAANYKAWTKAGYSGRDFFYWEKQLNGVSGGRDGRIPILLDSDLTNEQKALMMQMFDTADGYADGTVFYNKKGEAIIDFTAPSEKQQALPKPNAEPSEAPNAEPTAEPTPKPTENPLTEARQEGVQAAVKLGVPEQTAFDAFLAYQNMGKNKDESDGYSRNDEFREWLFKNVDSPEQMAVLEYQVIGQASSVKGAITYRDSGVVYRDYTNASWFKLSEHNLSKDGTNKRYEAGKQLEKTGLKVDKTVAIYDGLKELTKKAEWIDYLKKQNLDDDQIRIFLWSRGWKY